MKKVGIFWPGDYRARPNELAQPQVAETTAQLEQALKKLGRTPYRIPGFLTRPDEAIAKLGPVDDPLIGVFVHWTYGPHTCDGVTGKDIILAIIGEIGTAGGTGYVLEYAGDAIRALSMEGRMTVCNMSIEAGARAGLIAPDETTFQYLEGRPYAPKGGAWDLALGQWRRLPSDKGANFDSRLDLLASDIPPMRRRPSRSARLPDDA